MFNKAYKWIKRNFLALERNVFDFIHNYTLEIILMSFIGLGFCWAIGYFCNALYGMKFELQSCWAGFSAIGGAGVLAAVKYCMDSWKNTPAGTAPTQGLSASQRLVRAGEAALHELSENNISEK